MKSPLFEIVIFVLLLENDRLRLLGLWELYLGFISCILEVKKEVAIDFENC